MKKNEKELKKRMKNYFFYNDGEDRKRRQKNKEDRDGIYEDV